MIINKRKTYGCILKDLCDWETANMYCGHCGKKISEDSNFCVFCGQPTELQKPQNELAEFVRKARAGDKDAFGVLYNKTYNQVFYTVKSMIKDDDAVNDILQDSYVKAFMHMDSFKGDDKFLPWIKQIAANTARDWLKKKKPMLFTDLNDDDDDMAFEEQIEDEREENIPEKLIEQKETIRLVREIVDSLPDDQRAVIGMYYYENKSVNDIASAMGASQSAIKSRLKYGRDKIKAKVEELESRGTRLYGLAPFTFWLLLIRNMKGFTTELIPDANILHNIMESIDGISYNMTKTGHTGKGNVKAPGAGAAATTGSVGAAKIILIALISTTVIGGGVFGISKIIGGSSAGKEVVEDTIDKNSLSDKVESTLEETEAKESTEAVESTEATESISPNDEALEQYKIVVEQASTYKFSDDYYFSPTGNYQYALVKMKSDDLVQTLLLAQEVSNGDSYVRLFKYDTDTKVMHQPYKPPIEVNFSNGRNSANISLDKMANGNGLRIFGVSRGRGDVLIQKVTLAGDNLNIENIYTGRLDDNIPAEFDGAEIEWHNISDLSGFDTQSDNN